MKIFEGTRNVWQESDKLKKAVDTSRAEQKIYWEGADINFGEPVFSKPFNIVLSKQKTVEAARKYANAGKKVCILNFASSVSPGGGVVTGAQAQEESICRVSTLYFALSDKDSAGKFYDKHWELIREKKMNRRNTDDIIFTPGVVVVRDDSAGEVMLPEKDWYEVDVITCAAPDIRSVGDETEYRPDGEKLHYEFVKRWRCILAAGAKHKADVLILGAFGCGVFANPPQLVARAFCEAAVGFEKYFETIEIAIYSTDENNVNYNAFKDMIKIHAKNYQEKIVVMGGSFNPPTIAHQKMLLYVIEQLGADKGVFVPSPYNYVYAKMERLGMPEETLSDELRIKMLQAMCEDDSRLAVDDVECRNPENWYTTETMNYMQEKYPDAHLTCLGGADRVRGYINAYRFIPFTDKYSYTVVTRGDDDPLAILKEKPEAWARRDRFNIISAPKHLDGISSSAIRNKLRNGEDGAKDMCHPRVWELLMEYRNNQ